MFACIQTRLEALIQQVQLLPAVQRAKRAFSGQPADATWPVAPSLLLAAADLCHCPIKSISPRRRCVSLLVIPPPRLAVTKARWITETLIQITNACKYAQCSAELPHTTRAVGSY